ncbi:MAG: NAD-dependent epimerase/dehydratase family protein [Nitrospiraceae bacterium]|nr:NAD-dependent epimerase/dehydratase family protein [Nitrospiraceae bacterium]
MKTKGKDIRRDVRVGVIGCGNIARVHLKYITRFIDTGNIAVCDTNGPRLEDLAREFGLGHVFADAETMLKEFRPRAVHVLTPPRLHKDMALLAMGHGSHVFIEKPMCLSAHDAEAVNSYAEKNALLVCPGHFRLFDPATLEAMRLFKGGGFGEITHISITETEGYLDRKRAGLAPQWLTELPGEIFYDLLPHHLSLLYMFDRGLVCRGITRRRGGDGDLTGLNMSFDSPRMTASIHVSLDSYPFRNEMVLECTKGRISADYRQMLVTSKKKTSLPQVVERAMENLVLGKALLCGALRNIAAFAMGRLDTYAGMENLIREFYGAIEAGNKKKKSSPVPGWQGEAVAAVSEGVFGDKTSSYPKGFPPVRLRSGGVREDADVLVTGGTGFIGKRLVKALAGKGLRVRVLTHRGVGSAAEFGPNVQFVKGSISDPGSVETACRGVEKVYHLAAAMKGNWLYHLDTTVTGTRNVLLAAQMAGVRHIVYASTIGLLHASAYPKGGLVDEDFPDEANPEKRGFYSNAKLMAERAVREFQEVNPSPVITVLRPGLVYGPGKNLVRDVGVRAGRFMFVFGMGRKLLPLVYVDNLVDAMVLAGDSGKSGIFNVIDDGAVTERDFLKAYRRESGERFITVFIPAWVLSAAFWFLDRTMPLVPGRKAHLLYKFRSVNTRVRHGAERLKSAFGWEPRVKFDEGIFEMVRETKKGRG